MKGLYFTDKHDHPFNEFSKPTKDGRTTLLEEHYKTYDWIAQQILEHKPDFVVNLGDSVLTIGYVDALTITCVEYGDRKIRDACGMVGAAYHPMLGNHDLMNDSTRIHVLPFISGLVTDVCFRDGLFFLPFYRDLKASCPEKWIEQLSLAGKDVPRAFIHNDIVGARFNAAAICKSGVSPADFSKVPTIAGHFHNPQIISPTFLCIGSCMYRDFGDEVTEDLRGVIVDDFDGTWLRVPNPHTSMYQTLRVTDEDELAEKLQAIKHKDRTHLRLSYPESLQPFVDPYKPDFKSIKTIPMKERKLFLVNGVTPSQDALDPHLVLRTFLEKNAPANGDVSQWAFHLGYIDSVINKVLGAERKQRSRHQVRFLGLHAENFMGYLGLDVRFDEPGVVYVDGVIQDQEADVSNGSGKSTIFEAVNWCWYGDLIRESKELEGKVLVDDVVNDQVKGNCLVSMDVEIDGTQYQVLRTRKHKDYGSDLRLFVSGSTEPTAQGLEQAKKYLERITGADKDLFRHTTLLVDGLSTRFSQLSGRDRLELLEAMIQLDIYDQLHTVVDQEMKSAKAEHEGVKTSVGKDEQVIVELRQQREFLALNVQKITADLQATISLKQHELGKLMDEATSLDKVLEVQQQVARQLADAMSAARAEIPKFDDLQYQSTTSGINRDLGIMRKALQDKNTMLTGTCPTCNRPLAVNQESIKEDISRTELNIQGLEQTLQQWRDWERDQRAAISRFEERYREAERSYNAHLERIRGFGMQRQNLEPRIKSLRGDIQSTQQTMESNQSQLTTLDARIATVDAELEKLRKSLSELALKLDVRVWWTTALSPKGGVRMALIQDAIQQLNELAIDFSNTISNGRVSPLMFITPKGEIGFETTQIVGNRKYGLSSSGQRRTVDLGIQLALARLSSRYSGFSSNLLALDEIDDKLDASARRHLITLLEKIAHEEKKLVLIASHNKDIKSFVDRVWLVVQSGGISRLASAA